MPALKAASSFFPSQPKKKAPTVTAAVIMCSQRKIQEPMSGLKTSPLWEPSYIVFWSAGFSASANVPL